MWRCRRHRVCLVALALSSPVAPQCSGLATAAVPITDCAGLEALPASIVEDLILSFDGVEAIVCDKVRCGSAASVCSPLSSAV